jgi:hypothetical protein
MFGRGNGIPQRVFVHEPGQVAVEDDCAAIAHRIRLKGDDRAAKDATADAHTASRCFQLKLHRRAWKEPVRRFDEGAASGDIDY